MKLTFNPLVDIDSKNSMLEMDKELKIYDQNNHF